MMILVAGHAEATRRSAEPASRKRIRLANAFLMMFTLPLLAVGFSLLDPRQYPREWSLVWLMAMGLLAMNVFLAVLDALNTIRLLRRAHRDLRKKLWSPVRTPRLVSTKEPGDAGQ